MPEIDRPSTLQINGWSPDVGNLPPATPWGLREQWAVRPDSLAPKAPADERDWRHGDVGWGLVLPEPADDGVSPADRSTAAGAPVALQRLLRSRPGSPVLRWSAKLQQNWLRRYYPDGRVQDLSIAAPKPGTGDGRIPRYLLIYATPERIPWAVRYALNMSTFVGRLDIEGEALDAYVDALIEDWPNRSCRPEAPLVWSTDQGPGDITWLMARAVAGTLSAGFDADADLGDRLWLTADRATADGLATALAERRPGLIVTTSHGVTGPTGDPGWPSRLGLPVDGNHVPLDLALLAAWEPGGAIWYCHAWYSAGAASPSRYEGLLGCGNPIAQTLGAVAARAGNRVAPLPRELLGRARPLRAFVGHVERTFDWTLRDLMKRQPLTHVLSDALYTQLFQRERRTPIGHALRHVFREAEVFYGAWQQAKAGIDANVSKMRDWALYRQLVAMGRQTTVIIGDPTVSLPQLSGRD